MLLRAYFSFLVMVMLMGLVKLQINAADADNYLTVEQLQARGIKALSWDRHYAMVLVFCVVVPAFFFVGTHKFLGMINFNGAASSYPDKPLQDWVGWGLIVVATGLTWWRTYMLVPTSFWDSMK